MGQEESPSSYLGHTFEITFSLPHVTYNQGVFAWAPLITSIIPSIMEDEFCIVILFMYIL